MRETRPNKPDAYYWFTACRPILCAPDLSHAEKLVFLAFHGREHVDREVQPSMRHVGEWLRMDRRAVRRVLDSLERKGYVRRTHGRNENGTQIVRVETFIPEQAMEQRYLRRDGEEVSGNGTGEVSVQESVRGGDIVSPLKGGRSVPLIRDPSLLLPDGREEKGKRSAPRADARTADADRRVSVQTEPRGEPDPDPGSSLTSSEELDPDSGSREAEEFLHRRKEEAAAKRGGGSPTGSKRRRSRFPTGPTSGPALRETPSLRPELSAWRTKDPGKWSGLDLVGYWVHRHREVLGSEDPEFLADDVRHGHFPGAGRYLSAYASANGGPSAFRDEVELVLREAPARGSPVRTRYWFGRPGSRVVDSLRRPNGGRPEEPWRRNDRDALDLEWHNRRGMEDLILSRAGFIPRYVLDTDPKRVRELAEARRILRERGDEEFLRDVGCVDA